MANIYKNSAGGYFLHKTDSRKKTAKKRKDYSKIVWISFVPFRNSTEHVKTLKNQCIISALL
jgi:hypothetical protein